MNPIQLNKQIIEALNSGASMILQVIKPQGFTKLEVNEFQELTCSHCGHIVDNDIKHICLHCEGSICYENINFEIGQEYFVQEDFIYDLVYYKEAVITKGVFQRNGYRENALKKMKFINASEMKISQSKIKFKVKDIQVKRLHDLKNSELLSLGFSKYKTYQDFRNIYNPKDVKSFANGMNEFLNSFKEWFCNQYLEQPYDSNPYIFLIEIEKLK